MFPSIMYTSCVAPIVLIQILGTFVHGSIRRLPCRRSATFHLEKTDERMISGVMSKTESVSLVSCCLSCIGTPACVSLNFKHNDSGVSHDCELIAADSLDQWEESSGWQHYRPLNEIHEYCNSSSCPAGYKCEETCENQAGYKCTLIDHCLSSPCKNGGTCVNSNNGFTCTCTGVYTGEKCQQVQNCTSDCMTPICSNTGNGIRFPTIGRTGRSGDIGSYTIPSTAQYLIRAGGAKGGTHETSEGSYPGKFCGGNGAIIEGQFFLQSGTVLNIVVGHRGGDSVEISGGQATTQTAASLGKSIEDNAGTGGGGGSFVYTTSNILIIAAGGGGGATAGWNGIHGSNTENGTDSTGRDINQQGQGGSSGQAGQCCNTGNYHGGVGAGWLGQGSARAGTSHGERGGSRLQSWVGGQAGTMNSGNNGGPSPGAVGGFGGGGGGSEDNGASGGGGGYSGGGAGTSPNQAGGGGGSYCNKTMGTHCVGIRGGNTNHYGFVTILKLT